MEQADTEDVVRMAQEIAEDGQFEKEMREVLSERMIEALYNAANNPKELTAQQEADILYALINGAINGLTEMDESDVSER